MVTFLVYCFSFNRLFNWGHSPSHS